MRNRSGELPHTGRGNCHAISTRYLERGCKAAKARTTRKATLSRPNRSKAEGQRKQAMRPHVASIWDMDPSSRMIFTGSPVFLALYLRDLVGDLGCLCCALSLLALPSLQAKGCFRETDENRRRGLIHRRAVRAA